MKKFRDQSIRKKLRIIAMSSVLIAVLLTGLASLIITQKTQQRIAIDHIFSLGQVIAENCIIPLSFNIADDAADVLATLETRKTIISATLYNQQDNLFAEFKRQPSASNKIHHILSADLISINVPVIYKGEQIGYLIIDDDLSEMNQSIQFVSIALFYVMVIALGIAYLIAAKLQNLIVRPITELAQITQQISKKKSYTLRAKKYSEDELGKLTDAFNTMLNQLQIRDTSLRKSETSHRIIAEHAPEAIVILDIDSNRFVYANENAQTLYGLSHDKIMQVTPYEMSPEQQPDGRESKQAALAYIGDALQDKNPVFEWTHLNADHKEIACEVRLVRLPHTERNQVRASVTDISERKNAELELKRLRNFLKNIVDSMPSILVGVDIEGHVTQWNKEAERVTGISEKEAEGVKLAKVYPQFKTSIDQIQQAIKARRPWVDHRVISHKNGQIQYNDITVFPLITNGMEGAVVRIDDITERIRIEEMVIQSEKMLSVGGLAAGMAHELNNPLAGIIQNLQVIRNRLSSDLPKNVSTAEQCGISMKALDAYIEQRDIKSMIESVMQSGQRAAKIIDNMLSFSRKSSGYKESVTISSLLDKAVELAVTDYDIEKQYDFRQIEIFRDYDIQHPKVNCESNQIQQVFLNILSNSAQAMYENFDRNVTKKLILKVSIEDEWVCIYIEDNGSGMDEETRKQVFDPFFTTKDAGVGTGLGLSVSYFIVTENHHGHMSVDSTVGEGTRFIIKLPIDRL